MTSDKILADSVFERVSLTVDTLCTGPGDIRSRLVDAVINLIPLTPSEFPANIREDFEWTINQLSRYPARNHHECSLDVSMANISDRMGVEIAKRILMIYKEVQNIRLAT